MTTITNVSRIYDFNPKKKQGLSLEYLVGDLVEPKEYRPRLYDQDPNKNSMETFVRFSLQGHNIESELPGKRKLMWRRQSVAKE